MKLEATGKNVDIAIQNGLLECGLTREEVQVKVLEEGGLFKKAKVVLLWGEDAQAESNAEIKNNAAAANESEQTAQVNAEQNLTNIDGTAQNGTAKNVASSQKEEAAQVEAAAETETKPAGKEKPRRIVDTARLVKRGQDFLLGLAQMIDQSATVSATTGENEISFAVKGENLGKLIGYHGENIQALQFLLSGLKLRSEGPIRMYLDVDGYKSNRNQTIVDLANRVAEQAIKIERNIHLDPMSAYDRRIVHTTLQGRDDVTTESTGEGEKRHVVIKPIFKK